MGHVIYSQDTMDQNASENEENSLTKREASPKNVARSVKNYQCVYHGKSIECNHNCGKQGIPNYLCDFCDKSFAHKSNLGMHITSVHQGIKKFSCEICDKSFSEKGSLQRHVASVHQGIKNFSCEVCSKSFSRKNYLQLHITAVHPRCN